MCSLCRAAGWQEYLSKNYHKAYPPVPSVGSPSPGSGLDGNARRGSFPLAGAGERGGLFVVEE